MTHTMPPTLRQARTRRTAAGLTHVLPDVALLLIAAIWGGSYLISKDLSAVSSAAAVMCARFVPSALLLLTVQLWRRPPGWQRVVAPGLVLGVLRASTIALETIGVTLTSATNAGLIVGLCVLITPLMESVAGGRRLTGQLLGSVALALVGIAGLVGGNGASTPNLGDLLIAGAATTRAILCVVEARFTVGRAADVSMLTTVEITFGAVVSALWGGSALLNDVHHFGTAQWGGILYLSLGCTVIAFLGQLWATMHTSASRASMILGTEPGWALLIGLLIGGEHIGLIGIGGALILLMSLLWGGRAERRWRERGRG